MITMQLKYFITDFLTIVNIVIQSLYEVAKLMKLEGENHSSPPTILGQAIMHR